MTSDGPPPQYPPPPPGFPQQPPPNQPPTPPVPPGQFPGQQPGQFPGQQFNPPPGTQQWAPSPGYQPPPLRDLGGYNRPPQRRRGRVILGSIGSIVAALVVVGVIGAVVTHSSNSSKVTVSVPPLSLSFASLAPAPAPAPASGAASAPASGATQTATGAAAAAGSTITIKGQDSGEKLAVTLLKVAPKTTATDGFSTPPAGDRYFAAQFKLTNTGTEAYNDSADNDAVALDSSGKQYETDIVVSIAAGPLFGDPLNIAPGATTSGWIVFDVPTATTITSVEFTTDSGFGDSGRWTIQ
jgi:hypothetical protein